MGVAVLQPRDCLKNPSSSNPLLSPPSKMKLPNPTRATRTRPKRSHSARPASASNPSPQVSNNKLVMGQVKILKRGEQLPEMTPDPQPVTVKVELRSVEPVTGIVGGLYAGSSMVVASPPPSSVPLPFFVTKKIVAVKDATSDLRKMLRLDFS